tara:strand:+ start:1270 stop:2484 length:1215 start_codon:yes stop_codon:yes gene_type:complete
MGFFKKAFKKIGKGFKSAFKSIGKGIKSAMGKIGKFMGKIGIVGQLALMFTPVGAMMSNMFAGIGQAAGGVFTKVTGALAKGGQLAQGAGKILEAGANFAKAGHSAFKTVTEGVSTFVKEFGGAALNTIPGMNKLMPSIRDKTFTSAWNATEQAVLDNYKLVKSNFSDAIGGKMPTAGQQTALSTQKAAVSTKATTGTGPMKEGYQFPTDAPAAPEFGPLAENPSFSSPASGSMPQQSSFGSQSSSAINPITNKPYDMSNTMEGFGLDKTTPQKSLLGKAGDYVKEQYTDFLDGRDLKTATMEETVDWAKGQIDTIPDEMAGAAKTRLYQNVGLKAKAQTTVNQYSSYVPEFTTAPAGSYGSAEINDRAMQMQLTGTDFYQQSPFGAGAHFYTQQMARSIGGTV